MGERLEVSKSGQLIFNATPSKRVRREWSWANCGTSSALEERPFNQAGRKLRSARVVTLAAPIDTFGERTRLSIVSQRRRENIVRQRLGVSTARASGQRADHPAERHNARLSLLAWGAVSEHAGIGVQLRAHICRQGLTKPFPWRAKARAPRAATAGSHSLGRVRCVVAQTCSRHETSRFGKTAPGFFMISQWPASWPQRPRSSFEPK